jgi:23S rRNA pseudouridine2604 synthase
VPATDREPTRLSKAVAALVPCSRREAEQYIAEGWVRVDGQRIEEPQFRVTAAQRVELDPRARLQPVQPATLLVNKPAGMSLDDARALLGAAAHWGEDTSPLRFAKSHVAGLVTLLPLPFEASGLTVFSQDRRIIRKLTEEAAFVEQELVAEVAGTLVPDGFERLARGLVWNGKPLPALRASWQSEARLRIALKGFDLQRMPWVCAQVGLELKALRRIRIGRVPMARLPQGQWRYLGAGERF